ncbi:MAG: 1,4-dihydroxy-2-naphthoate octaprenyltransferase [Bacteroidales bacterium]|nr:1,4-dihydroxy-2-naphthoate octaprenyltransferase [Bacteroidales bacterium]
MWPILQSTRPRTLPLSVSGILAGTFLARHSGCFAWDLFVLLLLTAVLLQILSNLANELGDWKKGTDRRQPGRKALSLQSGKLTEKQLVRAIAVVLILAAGSGITLIYLAFGTFAGIIPIFFLVLGALALSASVLYSTGKRPYGYRGLGDVAVFLFFGPAAVGGSYYIYTGSPDPEILAIAVAIGLLATAVLNVNNIRDFENDEKFGKITFAVVLSRMSKTGSTLPATVYQGILIFLALILSAVFAAVSEKGSFLFLIAIPFFATHLYWLANNKGAGLDKALKVLIAGILVYALTLF